MAISGHFVVLNIVWYVIAWLVPSRLLLEVPILPFQFTQKYQEETAGNEPVS